jgi:hypothetical protein
MAETFLASASERQVWMTKYFQEYVRQSRFMPYMSNADIRGGRVCLDRAVRFLSGIPAVGALPILAWHAGRA